MDMNQTASPWGERRLVILAGAGVSTVSPSDVPDWWQFNQAVLDGIRERVFEEFDLDAALIGEIERMSLEDIGVALFSQVVFSSSVGAKWFDLVAHLNGSVPNPCHDAFARLASQGRLAAIVTTNFDTLVERAFEDAGVPLDVEIVTRDYVPNPLAGGPCRLVKVHGSVTATSTLVDLAGQKA